MQVDNWQFTLCLCVYIYSALQLHTWFIIMSKLRWHTCSFLWAFQDMYCVDFAENISLQETRCNVPAMIGDLALS